MKCPRCDHNSAEADVTCTACGTSFNGAALEEWQHLAYLRAWLIDQSDIIDPMARGQLLFEIESRRRTLRQTLDPAQPDDMIDVETTPLIEAETSLRLEPETPMPIPAPAHDDVAEVRRSDPLIVERVVAPVVPAFEPVTSTVSPDAIDLPKDERESRQAGERPSEKRQRPQVDWQALRGRVVAAAASGALLRGLLYLGAFMIVVSSTILVVRFWDVFPTVVQFGFIAAIPTVFYISGWLVYSKLELEQAGHVLVGIGSLLVAVDFAAVYQLGGLIAAVDPFTYWLIASIVCTGIYVLTAWRLPTEPLGYIALIGLTSCVVAAVYVLQLPLEWLAVAVACAGLVSAMLAVRFNHSSARVHGILRATQRLPLVWVPIAQLAAIILFTRDPHIAVPLTFVVATLTYALYAVVFPRPIFGYLAVATSLVMFAQFAWVIELPAMWIASVTCVVAALYLAAAYLLANRVADYRLTYALTIYFAGFSLLGFGIVAAWLTLPFEVWPAALAFAGATMTLVVCTWVFRRPLFSFLASGLCYFAIWGVLAKLLSTMDISNWLFWCLIGGSTLAIAYLAGDWLLRRYVRYAGAMSLWAHCGTLVQLPILLVSALLSALRLNELTDAFTLLLGAYSAMLFVYAMSAVLVDRDQYPTRPVYWRWLQKPLGRTAFLWPLAMSLPGWFQIAWFSYGGAVAGFGVLLCATALLYVLIGQYLYRRHAPNRLPLHLLAYELSMIGLLLAIAATGWLSIALLLATTTLICLTLVYKRRVDLGLAVVAFAAALQAGLIATGVTPHVWGVAYAVLALVCYGPLAVLFNVGQPRRRPEKYATILFVATYVAAIIATGISLLGRTGWLDEDVQWVGVVVPLLLTTLCLFSTGYFKARVFSWLSILFVAIGYGQLLTWLRVPISYLPFAWALFGLSLMLVERRLAQAPEDTVSSLLRLPLVSGALLFTTLGVGLTLPPTVRYWSARAGTTLPLLLAQSTALLSALLAARLYRSRWPLFVEPWLAALVTVLAALTISVESMNQPLADETFSLVLLGVALIHLAAALHFDGHQLRYADGLYLGGYTQVIIAIVWSWRMPELTLVTLGVAIAACLLAQSRVLRKQHHTWWRLSSALGVDIGTNTGKALQTLFLSCATCLFPVWLYQLLVVFGAGLPALGLAFAILAPIYVVIGRNTRYIAASYAWPFYVVAYALTGIALLLAVAGGDMGTLSIVLTLNAGLYAATAIVFRRPAWLYLTNGILPIVGLLRLDMAMRFEIPWVAGLLIALVAIDVVIGVSLWRRGEGKPLHKRFALPFLVSGYVLMPLALAIAAGDQLTAFFVYAIAVGVCAFSARFLRQPWFMYPVAVLLVVPYMIGVQRFTPVPEAWQAVALTPLIVAYILVGRYFARARGIAEANSISLQRRLQQPAVPFYLLAYSGMVAMLFLSWPVLWPLAVAFSIVSLLLFASALLFMDRRWLYLALPGTHLALLSIIAALELRGSIAGLAIPFAVLTWLLVLAGLAVQWREATADTDPITANTWRASDVSTWPVVRFVRVASWSQPFFLFAALDVVLWQLVALTDLDIATGIAASNALLLAILVFVWRDVTLAYGALSVALLAISLVLRPESLTIGTLSQFTGQLTAIALGAYLLAWAIDILDVFRALPRRVAIWLSPTIHVAMVLAAACVLISWQSLQTIFTAQSTTPATAATWGFAGAVLLAHAYRRRTVVLGYVAVALMQGAWFILLISQSISQPQAYAIPAGLYLVGIGVLERRRHPRPFSCYIELLGLAILLVTAFIQSLDPASGFPYFMLLLVESVLIIWWSTVRRVKLPFFVGIGAAFITIFAQLILLATVNDVARWIVLFGMGLLLVGGAVFVERRWAKLSEQVDEWRSSMAGWQM